MGTLTITTTAAQDTRLAKAFGAELGVGATANAAQIRGAVLQYLKDVTKKQEIKAATIAANAALESVTPLDVT